MTYITTTRGVTNIKTINDNAGGDPVEVDQRIIDLLLFAREMYESTGGRTNVMMGSVLSLWHDARENGINNPDRAYLPDSEELEAANEHTSMDVLVIDDEANTVQITDPEASLDVGAVAKGYAVQRVCDDMPEGLLVSVGGNVCATGPRPTDGSDWGGRCPGPRRGYERLPADRERHKRQHSVQRRLSALFTPLTACVMVTSLTRIRFYPPTYWRAVSILVDDSGLGDALSTALFCMDQESGQELLDKYNAVAVWIDYDGSLIYSDGFARMSTR